MVKIELLSASRIDATVLSLECSAGSVVVALVAPLATETVATTTI